MRRRDILAKAALFIAVTILFGGLAQASRAATFTVNSTLDIQDASPGNGVCQTATAGQCTLRAAITEANALAGDDVITLPAGTYTATLPTTGDDANAGGDFDIDSNITINGAGAGSTFIQGASSAGVASDAVLDFPITTVLGFPVGATTSTVSNVTIRYGYNGIVMPAGATVTLNSITASDNNRGGVLVQGGNLTANNSLITNNFWNVAVGSASIGGAGLYITGGIAAINNTTVSFNTIQSSIATIAAAGGGIRIDGGTLNLSNSAVSNNSVTVSDPSISADGGGIAILGGTVTINDSSVTNNLAASTVAISGMSNGGGISVTSANPPFNPPGLTLNRTYVGGNTAIQGGGIRRGFPRLEINQSAIINNFGSQAAGGILDAGGSFSTFYTLINNSTIAGNKTNGSAGGVSGASRLDVNFSTIARNTANQDGFGTASGGGILNSNVSGSIINLKNSVVADNTIGTGGVDPDISGAITSQGYNHVENVGSATFATTTGDATGTDPSLGALILNGSNSILIPAANSPVIDTIPNGTNGCGTSPFNVDQRSAVRPIDSNGDATAACEKGAVESPLAATAATVSIVGRIITAEGEGIARAVVSLTDSNGQTFTTVSNFFGYYRFEEMAVGETYIFSVGAKGYLFTTQMISLNEDLSELNFIGEPRKKRERQW